jgi:hypothetical protein
VKLCVTLAALLTALSVSDAYTASNAVSAGPAGAGSGAISGYAVSDISYELDGAGVSAVSFTLDPPDAGTARVRLGQAGAWHRCTLSVGAATCALGSLPLGDLDRLDVVASG